MPDASNPAEPTTPASPSPGGPATPAQPATPAEPAPPARPASSPEATQPAERDSQGSPSPPPAPDQPETTDAPSPEAAAIIEIEQVGELLTFLQPSAIPNLAGLGVSEGAHLSPDGGHPPQAGLAAGLELALPPRLDHSGVSSEAAVDLVTQGVQQVLGGLALPLAVAGLLAMPLVQAGNLSSGRKSRLRP